MIYQDRPKIRPGAAHSIHPILTASLALRSHSDARQVAPQCGLGAVASSCCELELESFRRRVDAMHQLREEGGGIPTASP